MARRTVELMGIAVRIVSQFKNKFSKDQLQFRLDNALGLGKETSDDETRNVIQCLLNRGYIERLGKKTDTAMYCKIGEGEGDEIEKAIIKFCDDKKQDMLDKYRKGKKEHGGRWKLINVVKEYYNEILDQQIYYLIDLEQRKCKAQMIDSDEESAA